MAIVNKDTWLAEHGGGQGAIPGYVAPGQEAPDHTPSASPSLRVADERDEMREVISSLKEEITLRDGEIARQADLIIRLQAALRAEVERQARAAAAMRGQAAGAPGAAPLARVIRKRNLGSGVAPEEVGPRASTPPTPKEKPHG